MKTLVRFQLFARLATIVMIAVFVGLVSTKPASAASVVKIWAQLGSSDTLVYPTTGGACLGPTSIYIEFGKQNIGGSKSITFKIKNVSSQPISKISLKTNRSEFTIAPASVANLGINDFAVFNVTFNPTWTVGETRGLFIVDTPFSHIECLIRGTATYPEIDVQRNNVSVPPLWSQGDTLIDIGRVYVSSTKTLVFDIANIGTGDLHIGSLSISNITGKGFTLSPLSPQTIVPGGKVPVSVKLTCSNDNEGMNYARISIPHDDYNDYRSNYDTNPKMVAVRGYCIDSTTMNEMDPFVKTRMESISR